MIGKKAAKSQVLLACLLIVMFGAYLVAAAPSTVKRQIDGPDALGAPVTTLYAPLNATPERDGFWTISSLNLTTARLIGQWNRLDGITCSLEVYIQVPRRLVQPGIPPTSTGKAAPTVAGKAAPTVAGKAAPTVAGKAAPTVAGKAAPTVAGKAAPTVTGKAGPAVDETTGPASSLSPASDDYITTRLTKIPISTNGDSVPPVEFDFIITNNLEPLFRATNQRLYIVFKETCRGGRDFAFRLIQLGAGEAA